MVGVLSAELCPRKERKRPDGINGIEREQGYRDNSSGGQAGSGDDVILFHMISSLKIKEGDDAP